ncbi:extracellular solute-binding protein [Bradyrhizobium sp. LHD-71]|uniref:ABC transporter substrate-binding protein n=1 Tax=Bradyrhizobium sp. LHD-71 TaxID=3072141 RepID=UPI00280F01E0|nr:extracellular solute-binding protein [Bradyrhizobium sp. LHD-71]MDQ8726349.1 extracellular solute-binding protein [Bradyrhizobium sp. LHD-71]
MTRTHLTRRQFTTAAAASVATAALGARGAAAQEYGPAELIDAAKKEGKIVYYTADFTEPEQEIIKAFNKRFPFVRVEMVRAPGGQLITRIKTEAAANKLLADVVNHSDRGLMKDIADLFQDYRPPNADAYRDDVQVSPQLWPKTTLGWSIAYNTELEQKPPRSWMDLCKAEYGPKKIGQVIAPSGGTTWTRIMFERQTFGDDYWKKQAATQPVLYPSGAPTADALVRGEVSIGVLLYNIAYMKKRDGAPLEIIFPSDGVPLNYYAAGVTKAAANPNAAKLFLNWCMSEEGQAFHIKELGYLTALKKPPFNPPGYDPAVIKTWAPNFEQYQSLRDAWIDEWNKTYGYRQ